jgi:VanZ family protein
MAATRPPASRFAFAAILALVLLSVLLPNTELSWMRRHWPWFNLPMHWIEHAHSVVNLVHALLFLALGAAARMAFPGVRAWRTGSAMLLLGVATELMQFFVPGRHPRLADVAVDVAAGMAGWAIARAMARG